MDPALVELLKAGGTMAFCVAVWYELRMQRTERLATDARQEAAMNGMREGFATLAEAVRGLAHHKASKPVLTPNSARREASERR